MEEDPADVTETRIVAPLNTESNGEGSTKPLATTTHRRRSRRRLALVAGAALLLAAPLLLGHGLEATLVNLGAGAVAVAILMGLPGKARKAFRS